MTITIQQLRALANIDSAIVEPAYEALTADRPLSGSDKQVAWAEDIRERALIEIARETCSRIRSYEEPIPGFDRVAAAIDTLLAKTDARWWIDNRASGTTMLRAALADTP